MASCDDDFSIYGDDNPHPHHHHQSYAPPRFISKPQIHAPPPNDQDGPAGGGNDNDDYTETAAFCSQNNVNPFSADENSSNPFDNAADQSGARVADLRGEKRKDREELSDGGTETPYSFKRGSSSKASEYRKDREEWSDAAIASLLEAYTDKFNQLNRGNLRGRDWEEVAAAVSQRCDKQKKSVEQCKNKVDNLKKRYKLEKHRMSSGGITTSHWPWFKQMEEIVGNSLPVKASAAAEEEKGSGASSSTPKQSKRYALITTNPCGQMANTKTRSLSNTRWKRVVFKISGAALVGTGPNNIDPKVAMLIAREVAMACHRGVQVAIVVGGSNFFCGDTWVTATGLDRCTAYQIGMMATVMNSVLLQSALEKMSVEARVQTAFSVSEVAEPYNRQRAIRHLEKGRVVIFGGIGAGSGNPLFSTDTAAALRASEIHADAVLKGTNVDGVYDCNSASSNATFEHISYRELGSRGGATPMDMMAITFCEENGIPVVVFNLLEPGNITRALCGEQVGTLIDQTGRIN